MTRQTRYALKLSITRQAHRLVKVYRLKEKLGYVLPGARVCLGTLPTAQNFFD